MFINILKQDTGNHHYDYIIKSHLLIAENCYKIIMMLLQSFQKNVQTKTPFHNKLLV